MPPRTCCPPCDRQRAGDAGLIDLCLACLDQVSAGSTGCRRPARFRPTPTPRPTTSSAASPRSLARPHRSPRAAPATRRGGGGLHRPVGHRTRPSRGAEADARGAGAGRRRRTARIGQPHRGQRAAPSWPVAGRDGSRRPAAEQPGRRQCRGHDRGHRPHSRGSGGASARAARHAGPAGAGGHAARRCRSHRHPRATDRRAADRQERHRPFGRACAGRQRSQSPRRRAEEPASRARPPGRRAPALGVQPARAAAAARLPALPPPRPRNGHRARQAGAPHDRGRHDRGRQDDRRGDRRAPASCPAQRAGPRPRGRRGAGRARQAGHGDDPSARGAAGRARRDRGRG